MLIKIAVKNCQFLLKGLNKKLPKVEWGDKVIIMNRKRKLFHSTLETDFPSLKTLNFIYSEFHDFKC